MKGPLGWTDWLVQKTVDFNGRDDRAWVENPRRLRWLVMRLMIGFIVGLGTLLYVSLRTPTPRGWETFIWVLFGLLVGRGFMNAYRRAGAYRDGWLAGRQAMLASMVEAQARGLSAAEWIEGEYERDFSMMSGTGIVLRREYEADE